MDILVGYTGFVGSNLHQSHRFDEVYHSSNITEAYGKEPDLLVYAGVVAAKYLANHAPDEDYQFMLDAVNNIREISPRRLVLISTVDVYPVAVAVDEESAIDKGYLQAYGANRLRLEEMVQREFPQACIVRLPGLYGDHIKKNFIYDYIHRIPTMLQSEKLTQLCQIQPQLQEYYWDRGNGFFQVHQLDDGQKIQLKQLLDKVGFSALNFTDSRGVYQFYPLDQLWGHIEIAVQKGLSVVNLATEPIAIAQLYEVLAQQSWENHLTGAVPLYDVRTKYDKIFGGQGGYVLDRDFILADIKRFVESQVAL